MSPSFVAFVVIISTLGVLIGIFIDISKNKLLKSFSKFDRFIYLLIIVNVIAMILESHKSINDLYGKWLSIFEAFSIYIFFHLNISIEFIKHIKKEVQMELQNIFSVFLV